MTNIEVIRAKKARLHMLYALAPENCKPSEANRLINNIVLSDKTPLCIYHDHFLGKAGGLAFFDITDLKEIDELEKESLNILEGWSIEIRPLIFSHNPAAFDEQIAYTIDAYSNQNWDDLKKENRPTYVSPIEEVETASDD